MHSLGGIRELTSQKSQNTTAEEVGHIEVYTAGGLMPLLMTAM